MIIFLDDFENMSGLISSVNHLTRISNGTFSQSVLGFDLRVYTVGVLSYGREVCNPRVSVDLSHNPFRPQKIKE